MAKETIINGGGASTQSNSIDSKASVLSGYSLSTSAQTIVSAINEILPKATGVGRVDPNSDGSGEIFNRYRGVSVNVASGEASHAEGSSTTASGNYGSHAEGSSTTASGSGSHAEGQFTNASGNYSHAEGSSTTASGSGSHAEGQSTTASGNYSHAEGQFTNASAHSSHAEGYYTTTLNSHEHAEGSYNKSYSSEDASVRVIHSIGIGSRENDRRNAHEIKFNGDHYIYGLGRYNGTNSADAQTLQEVINSKQATITAGTGLEFEGNTLNVTLDTTVFKVVSALPDSPAQGDENKIHLIPADNVSTQIEFDPEVNAVRNEYTEYIWTGSNWEELGRYYSEVDLTPYLKSTDAASTYLSKTDASSTYINKTDASATYLSKTDASSTYETVSHASSTYATAANLNSAVSRITALEDKQTVVTEVPTLTAAYTIPANATMVEKIYMITIGATTYDVTGATGIKWAGGVAPTTSANSILVVSVLNNLATWQTFV